MHPPNVDDNMHTILQLLVSQMEATTSEAEEVEATLARLDETTTPQPVIVALQSVQAMFWKNAKTLQDAIDIIEETFTA